MEDTLTVTIKSEMLPFLREALKKAKEAFQEESMRKLEAFDLLVAQVSDPFEKKEFWGEDSSPRIPSLYASPTPTPILRTTPSKKRERGETALLIEQVLKCHPDGLGMTELQNKADTSPGGTWRALNYLEAKGFVENRDRKWFWRVTPPAA